MPANRGPVAPSARMSAVNRPPSGSTPGQLWSPGASPTGVACPACGLANEPGTRTCRNCGLPVASAGDPVRGVAPGRVDLPKVRRSGASAAFGFVVVVALLLAGGSLAVSGGGGLLSSGGRFFGAEATPSPTAATVVAPPISTIPGGESLFDGAEPTPQAKGTKFDFTCSNAAIEDLGRGKWLLSDVQAGLRTAEDGSQYDQVYWKMKRTTKKKDKNGTTASMIWSTPKELQERFGIGRLGGDRAILVTFNGPVQMVVNQTIERDQLEGEGIDQVRRVIMFEQNGKVRTAVGLSEDSCARMRSTGWGKKAKLDAGKVVLDIERVYTGS